MSTALLHPPMIATLESQDPVGTKEDVKKLQGQMGTVLGILGKLNLRKELPSDLQGSNAIPLSSHKSDWIWTRLVPALAVVVAALAWLEPRFSAHREQDLRDTIKIEVGDQLKEPLRQVNNMQEEIAEIQGELKRISFDQLGTSDEKTFAASLSYLRELMNQSASGIPQTTLSSLAKKLRQTPESSKDYWPTVLQFIQFASSSMIPAIDVPSPEAKFWEMHNVTCSGFAHCIEASHRAILLDGGSIPGSIFDHCRIRFTENPTGLSGVTFINCVFEMPVLARPSPYLKGATKILLAGNLAKVSFPKS